MTTRTTVIRNASWRVAHHAVMRSGATASRKNWGPGRCLGLLEKGLALVINGEEAVLWSPHSIDMSAEDWVVLLPAAEA